MSFLIHLTMKEGVLSPNGYEQYFFAGSPLPDGLSSYGKKFEIVRKELYVDHETWAKGADYKLGVKLAKAFNKAGYDNADYTATPFVIISDVYAATGYSEELEEYIQYYNNKRIKLKLNGKSPVQYRTLLR